MRLRQLWGGLEGGSSGEGRGESTGDEDAPAVAVESQLMEFRLDWERRTLRILSARH